MKKNRILLLIAALVALIPMTNLAQMTSTMADGNSSHGSSSSSSGGSSGGGTYSSSGTSGTDNSKQRRDEIMATHVNTLYRSLRQLANSRMNEVDSRINRISFHNPFDKGTIPSQQVVKDWDKVKQQMEDKSEDNDYAKLSAKTNTVFNIPGNNDPDGYFTIPDQNPQEMSLAKYFSMQKDIKVIYAAQDLVQGLSGSSNAGGGSDLESLTKASFIVADKGVDDLLDNAEPALGGHLKMIRDLGYKTINLFSKQVDNFYECKGDCVGASEALYTSYKADVTNAFVGLVPGVDDLKGTTDKLARDAEAVQEYFKTFDLKKTMDKFSKKAQGIQDYFKTLF